MTNVCSSSEYLWTPLAFEAALDRIIVYMYDQQRFRSRSFLLTKPGFEIINGTRRRRFGPTGRKVGRNPDFTYTYGRDEGLVCLWGEALPGSRLRRWFVPAPPPELPEAAFEHFFVLRKQLPTGPALGLAIASAGVRPLA